MAARWETNVKTRRSRSEWALVIGAPALLALVELIHPHPHDLLHLDVPMWLVVHYAQIPLFPLAALGVVRLVQGRTGIIAGICRAAMFVFGASWTAWDAVAGVATGILVNAAHSSGAPEAWRAPIDAIWEQPIMGGGTASVFAVMGAIALSVGTVFAAIALKRAGSSWLPVLLLAISGFGITAFKTHAWPGGPLTFGGLAIAGAWLLLERARLTQPDSGAAHESAAPGGRSATLHGRR
jgi:hypothetical protein